MIIKYEIEVDTEKQEVKFQGDQPSIDHLETLIKLVEWHRDDLVRLNKISTIEPNKLYYASVKHPAYFWAIKENDNLFFVLADKEGQVLREDRIPAAQMYVNSLRLVATQPKLNTAPVSAPLSTPTRPRPRM